MGLYRAAVEDADACLFGLADDPAQLVADEGVHLGDICRRRGQPGADRPDRLVGDDEIGRARRLGNRAAQLPADDGERLARLALALRLADADDGGKPGAMGGRGLGADLGVLLAVVLAALGMADDREGRPGIGEHLGGDVAGEGAGFLGVAILPADRDP